MVTPKKNKPGVKAGKKISPVLDLRRAGRLIRAAFPVKKKVSPATLRKFQDNPIIEPAAPLHWESKATFNPSAIYGGGKVHLIYRAIGDNNASTFGHATSSNGFTIDERSAHPVFFHHTPVPDRQSSRPIAYLSGGGWNGGSEDPRLTLIDGKVYMLYLSFNGWESARIALTSISFEDFARENWHWKRPVFISPPGEVHKNWVLFPDKIKGKFAILHGISPRILIEYVTDLDEFDGTKFIHSVHPHGGHRDSWDSSVRGVGPAPIKTKYGWLVLYHAMDMKDPNRYKLGALLLDFDEPTTVIAHSDQPILEPDEWYENEGFKSGVVYACGAAVVDGWLFVYYGGADKVVCVATAELEPFLKELMSSGSSRLTVRKL